MKRIPEPINVGIIGTGWCGGIRAVTAAASPLVGVLHIAETNEERRSEMAVATDAETVTGNWEDLIVDPDIQALMISATPESVHYPMAKAALDAGKHVLLEKPMALSLEEADELIEAADSKGLKFTIGYSQRFNTKQALAKRSMTDGTIGDPVSILISRHIGRSLGAKIGTRGKFSPAVMEATHDIDTSLWLLEPRQPVRVYSQLAWGARADQGVPDTQYLIITMDDGTVVNIGAGWSLPVHYANASNTWIEVIGTDGALMLDATYKDVIVNTVENGIQFSLSTMPGEFVDHVYAGPMERETQHFLEAVAYDREVMVDPKLARTTMEVYLAADLSAQQNRAIDLPLDRSQLLPEGVTSELSVAPV
jgi:scyllo-inositol 2-dehydrogenase (NAD+)